MSSSSSLPFWRRRYLQGFVTVLNQGENGLERIVSILFSDRHSMGQRKVELCRLPVSLEVKEEVIVDVRRLRYLGEEKGHVLTSSVVSVDRFLGRRIRNAAVQNWVSGAIMSLNLWNSAGDDSDEEDPEEEEEEDQEMDEDEDLIETPLRASARAVSVPWQRDNPHGTPSGGGVSGGGGGKGPAVLVLEMEGSDSVCGLFKYLRNWRGAVNRHQPPAEGVESTGSHKISATPTLPNQNGEGRSSSRSCCSIPEDYLRRCSPYLPGELIVARVVVKKSRPGCLAMSLSYADIDPADRARGLSNFHLVGRGRTV